MELDKLYNNIDQQGTSAIKNHQEQLDEYLLAPETDFRRGLTIINSLPAHIRRNIMFCIQKLATVEPVQYFYPANDLHITVIDLIAANSKFHLSVDDREKYIEVLSKIVSQVNPIHWKLKGVIASPGALLVKGYYSHELVDLRDLIRKELPANNLVLQERYQTISGHVTFARFTKPLQGSRQFLDALAKMKTMDLGEFTTNTLDLVVHDWYNRSPQLISKLPLRY
ncbi:2'-5' RNA ligase family protein [Limosilactobacillus caviae]|uniref:2'-5' RNA ligase n=1 Tax=Limosilactobacillus caviae TaxID=1769424 RepID=A0ABQ2C6Z4_9LACO|nr:hypothetical protein [Limosilactobacillus caviae]MCD7123625.1 hypothetical protein [Limosilactobacillus caviae]MRH47005.1 hypothetical protein [Limosilactobacillus reuteri]GGI63752.1 hypothetical protein GCM10011459_15860 [Limosilactobacillus caviae]